MHALTEGDLYNSASSPKLAVLLIGAVALVRMALRHTDNQIANALGVSVPTIKTHVRSILKKMGARNRAGAVTTAFRSGLLT